MTNGNKIRQMSDEELAEWINKQITDFAALADVYFCSPENTLNRIIEQKKAMYENWLKWLKSEAKE